MNTLKKVFKSFLIKRQATDCRTIMYKSNNYVQICTIMYKFLTKALYPEYIFKTVKPNNNEASLIKT